MMRAFLSKEIMRVLQAHRGRENAMPRRDMLERLRLFMPELNDRGQRRLYAELPVATCPEGLFIPRTQAEVAEFRKYLENGPGGPIAASRRVGIILSYYPALAPIGEQGELPY